MCDYGYNNSNALLAAANAPQWKEDTVAPEALIAGALRRELGVIVNEQALRIFIRKEWRVLSTAAHRIHNAT